MEKGALELLQNMKFNKAPGPDSISPEVLKEFAPEIALILTLIFKNKFNTHVYIFFNGIHKPM